MLTYNLENRGKKTLYEYLYVCIREDIRNQVVKPGEKLPSKRELASHMGISVITVQNTYEQLLLEGYVYSVERKGYFVSNLKQNEKSKAEPEKQEKLSRNLENEKKEYLIDFSSNHIAASQFPAATWARLMRKTLLDNEAEFLKSPPHTGVEELKIAIANHLQSFRNLSVDPCRIIIGAGTEYLYGLVVQLIGHSRMIAVEDPGHTKIAKVYESNGAKVVHIPVDQDGLRLDRLIQNPVSCVHISPSHHFPTGIIMPAKRRHELVAWAKEKNGYIIEDDYDSEFRFSGRPISAMASIAPDRVIYMNTFSKSLLPSIRIAYMILPKKLMDRYRERLEFYSNTVSSFEQYNLAHFISEGYYDRYLNRMRNYYRKHRDILLATLKESRMYQNVIIEEENSGLHFILGIKKEINDSLFVEMLEERGIKIMPVAHYSHNQNPQFRHRFIINYSDAAQEHFREAFDIMAEIIENPRVAMV